MKNLLLTLLVLFPTLIFSQTKSTQNHPALTTGTPESAGMSSERLANIDRICHEAIEAGDVPGMVVLVARKGKIVYHKAFGESDVKEGKKFQTNDIFRIASQTKAITSTAVMMLWEEGHFRLDDPISKWIPEFKNPRVLTRFNYSDTTYASEPAKREITIRHLLTHTSGIGYGPIDRDESFQILYAQAGIEAMTSMNGLTTKENIINLAKMPLHFHPGDEYSYSMSLDVLGYFVEIISGMPFDQFLKTRIFDPLGMKDTYFYLPGDKGSRLIALQVPGESGWMPMERVGNTDSNFPITGSKTLFAGGGGLSSTTSDYATFLQMYLNGGELNGVRLLSRTTIQSMMGNQIGDLWGDRGSYHGLGFEVVDAKGQDQGGRGSTGTFSWGGAFNTQYFADPEEEIIGLIFKQTLGQRSDKTNWQFKQIVFSSVDD
ncbi:MAG: beta-lactamase family protein [Bacteroidetes bacterium]|nr:beta-lactamase family protein [Bacteroidota bacterium]